MDNELKNYLDEIQKNLKLHMDSVEKNVNQHTDKVGQNIRNDFSNRFGHLELDLETYKVRMGVKLNLVQDEIDNIHTTFENNGMTFTR